MLTSPIRRTTEKVAKKIESWLEKPIAWLEERSKIRGEPLSGYGAKFAKGMLLSVPQTVRFVGVVPYGVEKVIRKPSLLKKTPEFAVEFAKTTWHEARTRPFEFAGEFVGSTLLLGAAGRVARVGAARVGLVGAEAGEVGVLERLVGRATRRYVKPSKLIPEELELPKPKFSTLRVAKTAEPEEVLRFFKRSGGEVWHATPLRFEPKTVVLRGVSPTEGLYVAPKPYPKFALAPEVRVAPKLPKLLRQEFKPTFYKLEVEAVELPKFARVGLKELREAEPLIASRLPESPLPAGEALRRFAGYKKFVEELAPKQKAYISPEVMAKIPWHGKLEVEAVVPAGARLEEALGSRLLPRWTEQTVIVKKPTLAARAELRSFYEWAGSELKRLKAEERPSFLKDVMRREQELWKSLERRGLLRERTARVRIDIRRMRVLDEELGRFSDALSKFRGRRALRDLELAAERVRRGVLVVERSESVARTLRRGVFRVGAGAGAGIRASPPLRAAEVRRVVERGRRAFEARREFSALDDLRRRVERLAEETRSEVERWKGGGRRIAGRTEREKEKRTGGGGREEDGRNGGTPIGRIFEVPPSPRPEPRPEPEPTPIPVIPRPEPRGGRTPQPVLPELERRVRRVREKKERARSKLAWFEASKFTRITPIAAPEELVTGTLVQKKRR